MIKDKNIKITITNMNRRFYKKFEIKEEDETLLMNQEELSKGSGLKVECECDACGRTHFMIRKNISNTKTYCSNECNYEGRKPTEEKIENKKNYIKKKFKKRIEEGKGITYKDFKNDDKNLLWDIERYFGNLSNICRDFEISKEDMLKNHGFTYNIDKRNLEYEEIRERLLFLKSKGKLNTSLSRKEWGDGQRLERSVKNMFGSFEKGLEHFKLERDFTDSNTLIKSGRKFELKVKEILSTLEASYEYQKRLEVGKRIIPDFVMPNGVWLDAKLSSWTDSIEKTIEDYTPHCKSLIIVYLRGEKRKDIINEKVKIVKIDEFFPYLVNVGREDIIKDLKDLRLSLERND